MFLSAQPDWPVQASLTAAIGTGGKLIAFFGAGIYEEVLFRLTLLPLVVWGFRISGLGPRQALVGAVVATSLLFSGAHYIGPHGQVWDISTFLFCAVAGGFFAVLFVYRGFGIAAGTHAMYDILVGLLLTEWRAASNRRGKPIQNLRVPSRRFCGPRASQISLVASAPNSRRVSAHDHVFPPLSRRLGEEFFLFSAAKKSPFVGSKICHRINRQ